MSNEANTKKNTNPRRGHNAPDSSLSSLRSSSKLTGAFGSEMDVTYRGAKNERMV